MGDERWDRVRADIAELFEHHWLIKPVWVQGLEVSQTIQHYRADQHLGDPNDRGPDNSVQLIASKPAWVRVYGRARFADSVPGMTGTLTIERRALGFQWNHVATLSPQTPGSFTVRRDPGYVAERGNILSTLNFVIPASQFLGTLRLTARLVAPDGAELDQFEQIVNATLRQTLRVRAILVAYNGPATAAPPPPGGPVPNLTLAAPTLANVAATAARALRAMPVQSQGNFASAGTITFNRPLDDPRSCAGCCSANWNTLLTQLTTVRTNDGNRTDVVYYGLLPAGIPLNVPGCGQGGLGSAAVGDQGTFMHEIGHGYGFQHTPCGNGGTADPNYPTYEPYAAASIGEYGLDVNDGTILAPNGTFDYMSYCGPQWMSLYQHRRLIQHARLGQEWIREDLPWRRFEEWREYWKPRDLPYPPPDPYVWEDLRMTPVIAISGIVHGPGRVEVQSVARVAVMGDPPGERTSLHARLVGADGEVVASAALRRLRTHGGCGCADSAKEEHDEGPYSFEAYVADVEPGTALVIDDGEERLWERVAPRVRPVVGAVRAEVDGCRMKLWWEVGRTPPQQSRRRKGEDRVGELETWVQWSPDEGTTWLGLATGLRGRQAELDVSAIRPGVAWLRMLVHDGFHTAVSEPIVVEVEGCGPMAAILHPDDGGIYGAGSPLRLFGSVMDASGAPVPEAWCRWVLDGKEVAQGLDEWIRAPGVGAHHLALYVRTKRGEIEAAVRFRCEPGPHTEEGRPTC
jgi:hypothetical protein